MDDRLVELDHGQFVALADGDGALERIVRPIDFFEHDTLLTVLLLAAEEKLDGSVAGFDGDEIRIPIASDAGDVPIGSEGGPGDDGSGSGGGEGERGVLAHRGIAISGDGGWDRILSGAGEGRTGAGREDDGR